ncbi:MAG: PAS domain-containing protein [Proteobacteria bacterium]|nr:PAS domain-containing protein [Pseudomonadota bacterium]
MMIRNVRIPLEEMNTPRLQEVHAYWIALKGERFAPRPDEIRPEGLRPNVMPFVVLTDILREPFDLRFRLIGTAIVDAHGIELTGTPVADLRPREYADLVWRQYLDLLRERAPQVFGIETLGREERWSRQVVFRAPLSSDGETIDTVLAVDVHEGDPEVLNALFTSD